MKLRDGKSWSDINTICWLKLVKKCCWLLLRWQDSCWSRPCHQHKATTRAWNQDKPCAAGSSWLSRVWPAHRIQMSLRVPPWWGSSWYGWVTAPHSLATTNHGVGWSRASAGLAALSITACCTSVQWLREGKAWCPLSRTPFLTPSRGWMSRPTAPHRVETDAQRVLPCNTGARYNPQLTTKQPLLRAPLILPSPGRTVQRWSLAAPLPEKPSLAGSETVFWAAPRSCLAAAAL